ncbi:hypothetical protein H6P81_014860 [Aristolochia fimbriata]|uniref:Ribosomal protein S10 n=1 Tax=Aristolochia fimbriata TaxID=158543 RepID=A0AAV7E3M7_ARIFI|nr:hypothetical protein H6P81_014860 [Aristolochia fimbriata]
MPVQLRLVEVTTQSKPILTGKCTSANHSRHRSGGHQGGPNLQLFHIAAGEKTRKLLGGKDRPFEPGRSLSFLKRPPTSQHNARRIQQLQTRSIHRLLQQFHRSIRKQKSPDLLLFLPPLNPTEIKISPPKQPTQSHKPKSLKPAGEIKRDGQL